MKYVVLQEKKALGLRCVVLCTVPMTHADLAAAFAATHRPVSAGFCLPCADGSGRYRVGGYSDSLRLGPAAGDAPLLETFARVTAAQVSELNPRAA